MPQTTQAAVQSLVDRAIKLGDRQLAADIRAFAQQRQFGLVFEHNRPERMRLYGKKVGRGDVVQVLPERGKKEDAESQLLWLVKSVSGGVAELEPYRTLAYDENDGEPREAALEDVVAVAEYDQPIYAGLRETGRVERGGDKPYQVVINGENYHALETLAFAYAGKVDCIYIDPPYNTGARDWKYNNDYVGGDDAYRHSKWLAFMERRLKLAKQLLNPQDSVLIVTIDEKEYARLELLLESVFPNATGIQTVSITINKNGVARGNQFKRADEYAIFCFIGDAAPCQVDRKLYSVEFGELEEKVAADESGSRSQRKVRWEWLLRGGPNAARTARPNLFYPIYIDEKTATIRELGESLSLEQDWTKFPEKPGLRAIWPIRTDGREATWRISQGALQAKLDRGCAKVGEYNKKSDRYSLLYLGDSQEERLKNGEIKLVGKAEDGSLLLEEQGERSAIPTTVWSGTQFSAGEYGSRYIKRFIGERHFTFPKSLYATELSLASVIADKPDALVVDFFSGSGTTAHAAMRLNHQDGGRRRSISITNNEVSEDEAKKLTKRGLRQGDPEWEALGICQYVTKPRVTAAITGKTPDGDPIKGDYKFTDEFPMADGFEENAVFYDLTYQDPDAVELGVAFEEIAPLLWLRAGSHGRVIEREAAGYEVADAYGVLFDFAAINGFAEAAKAAGVGCAYVVTDDTARYASVKAQLPGVDVVRLYENYLQSFKIAAEDAVR
ncbi:site-specific DNA-methyltransferase [Paratractidigestivibacter sp.]|uniref:site-specific DNA-methyltransferase n=1 Tax=Paratractidigestivibacter sp. TaxID=2847316 RepID=UPI002ACB0A7F|nr:site-specific DNA-methyltransferase [Paratractidigestivibacter sp.]